MERQSVTEFWLSAVFAGMTAYSNLGHPSAHEDKDPARESVSGATMSPREQDESGLDDPKGSSGPLYEFRIECGDEGNLICALLLSRPRCEPQIIDRVSAASLEDLTARLDAIDVSTHFVEAMSGQGGGNLAVLQGARRRLLAAHHRSAFEFAKDDLLQELERLERRAGQLAATNC